MRATSLVLVIVILSQAVPALATLPQAAQPTTKPTMFAPVPRSLQQLLTEGYQIVNLAIGLSGFGYLLKHDTQYVTCAVQPDRTKPDVFVSECRAMN